MRATAGDAHSRCARQRRDLIPMASSKFNWIKVGEGARDRAPPYAAVPTNRSAPKAIVHLVGGALVGAVPKATYGYLASELASEGFLVIAGSYGLTFDHRSGAKEILHQRDEALTDLGYYERVKANDIGLFAVGHSNGAVLLTLSNSLPELQATEIRPQGTALLGYTNLPVSQAVPGGIPEPAIPLVSLSLRVSRGISLPPAWQLLASAFQDEEVAKEAGPVLDQLEFTLNEIAGGAQDFTPTPEESRAIAEQGYHCRATLFLRFREDGIDESRLLASRLQEEKVGGIVEERVVPGNHLTPIFAEQTWNVGGPFSLATQAGKAFALRDLTQAVNTLREWMMAQRAHLEPM